MIRMLLAGLGLVLLAGCSTPPAAPSAPQLPQRPRSVPVLGLDPCALMPDGPLAELRIEPTGKPVELPPEAPQGARACGWDRSILERPSAGVSIGIAPQRVAGYLNVSGSEQTTVAGFPAVDAPNWLATSQQSCDLLIDVAPEQALIVSYYNTRADEVGATHALMCDRAHLAADAVMRKLLTTRR